MARHWATDGHNDIWVEDQTKLPSGYYLGRSNGNFNIGKRAIQICPALVYKYYCIDNVSREDLAITFNCSLSFIKKYIQKFNIPHKTKEQHMQNIVKSNISKYGVDNVFKSYVIKEKISSIKYEKYGNATFTNPEKMMSTRLQKYGVKGVRGNRVIKYKYDDICFDSSWELALYIYAKDHDEDILYEPCTFEYKCNGKIKYYIPDFLYKGNLIEIKADNCIDANNNLIVGNYKATEDKLAAKTLCMKSNNVLVYKYKDVKPFIDYVKNTYGCTYLKKFKLGGD